MSDTTAAAPEVAPAAVAPAADWKAGLSEDLRVAPALHDIADVDSLAKQFVDQQAFMGNSLRVPGPDAGPEDISAFHKRLIEKVPGLMPTPDAADPEAMSTVYDAMGRPAAADQYTRAVVEGQAELNPILEEAYAEASYEFGLSQRQHEGVFARFQAAQADIAASQQAHVEIQQAELRQEWGYTHDSRMTALQNTLQKFGFSEGVIEAAAAGGLGKQDSIAFYAMVQALGGESEIAGQQGSSSTGMTPAEADIQISEIMHRKEYHDPDLKVRQPWIDKVQALMKFSLPNAMHGDEARRDLRRSAGSG